MGRGRHARMPGLQLRDFVDAAVSPRQHPTHVRRRRARAWHSTRRATAWTVAPLHGEGMPGKHRGRKKSKYGGAGNDFLLHSNRARRQRPPPVIDGMNPAEIGRTCMMTRGYACHDYLKWARWTVRDGLDWPCKAGCDKPGCKGCKKKSRNSHITGCPHNSGRGRHAGGRILDAVSEQARMEKQEREVKARQRAENDIAAAPALSDAVAIVEAASQGDAPPPGSAHAPVRRPIPAYHPARRAPPSARCPRHWTLMASQ